MGGFDISVYIVEDSTFQMHKDFVWPACLPKAEQAYLPGNKGILAGWIAPIPTYIIDGVTSLVGYALNNLFQREALFERVPCADPQWMKSSTYYPPGIDCFTDAAWASSVEFGVSGSGIYRPFLPPGGNLSAPRYSWAGPASLSKGSDYTTVQLPNLFGRLFGRNPAVFTDGRCYLDWVAAQYDLTLPPGYIIPDSCAQSSGSRLAVNNTNCLSRTLLLNDTSKTLVQPCNFSLAGLDKCQVFSYNPNDRPSALTNFFYCINDSGNPGVCANDCPGMDPNSVVVGGEVAFLSLAVATSTAPGLLTPTLGAGSILAMMGLGGMAMNRGSAACPSNQCRGRLVQRCCALVLLGGRRVCPSLC
jgi:hypothetical protein